VVERFLSSSIYSEGGAEASIVGHGLSARVTGRETMFWALAGVTALAGAVISSMPVCEAGIDSISPWGPLMARVSSGELGWGRGLLETVLLQQENKCLEPTSGSYPTMDEVAGFVVKKVSGAEMFRDRRRRRKITHFGGRQRKVRPVSNTRWKGNSESPKNSCSPSGGDPVTVTSG